MHSKVIYLVRIDIYLNAMSNVAEMFPGRSREDGLYYVIDFDLAELRQLRIHERVRPLNGTQVYPLRFPSNSSVNFQLATLNETIELLLGLNYATGRRRELLIEIKKPEYHSQNNRDISSIVLSTLNAYNLTEPTDPVIIQTFYIEGLTYIRRNLNSRLRLFALMTWNRINESSSNYDYYRTEEGIQNLSTIVQALTPFHEFLVDYNVNGSILGVNNFTKWAHQYGLQVYPFTYRKDSFPGESFEGFLHYFWHTVLVDGFITDHPDVVLKYLTEHKHSEPYMPSSSSHSHLSIVLLLLTIMIAY